MCSTLGNDAFWKASKSVITTGNPKNVSFYPQRKSLIASSLIVVVSLFVVVVNYSQKPYFLLQPVFGQTFSSHWMFSKQPYKAYKPHLGYVSIPKQEVSEYWEGDFCQFTRLQ